jgi:hypothetical protein
MKGTAGFRGQKYVGPGNYLYSNGVNQYNITHSGFTKAAILNWGQGWSLFGPFFEGTDDGDGSAGMLACIDDDLPAGATASGNAVFGGWAGDMAGAFNHLVSNGNTQWSGTGFFGGFWTPATSIIPTFKLTTLCKGFTAQGMAIGSFFDLANVQHLGINISGNAMYSDVVNISASSEDVFIVANTISSGYAENTIRLHTIKEWRIGQNGATGSTGTWSFYAGVATDGNLWLNADAAQNKFVTFAKAATPQMRVGVDNSANGVEICYDAGGGFVGYSRTVTLATLDTSFGGHVNVASGKVYKVNGTQVVGPQGAAVADPGAITSAAGTNAAAAPTQAEFNALVAEFNKVRTDLASVRTSLVAANARLRAHGLYT